MKVTFVLSILLAVALAILDNGLAKTPQMGWNSWNKFACNVNETVIRDTIDLIVKLKLDTLGYNYVNIDDCWAESRDANGIVVVDSKSFPNGIKALADYAHSKGLLFGIYSDAGSNTCAGRPGSLGHELDDAKTYAEWGVDYLKYDNCNADGNTVKERYTAMAKALHSVDRPIFFSMCEWGVQRPAEWGKSIGGNSWRTTGDISDNWNSMLLNALYNDADAAAAGPGGWNDPVGNGGMNNDEYKIHFALWCLDLADGTTQLEVGNGGMNNDEYKIHFALWCLVKAPLLIGCDLSSISKDTLSILGNKEAIAVNQDSLGQQGTLIIQNGQHHIWAGKTSDGYVVLAYGVVSDVQKVTLDIAKLSGLTQFQVRDIYAGKDVGTGENTYEISFDYHKGTFLKFSAPQ
ncbi:hypothetical protein PROFUN_00095 [Planoprotostelium fungivorum]|uniref:Alpha-galactosidase n=1 Tax=Planoprotostelium fungivorum TaxID=1890364 RepID=A0A2P6P0M4_9EUKA|nr:hypothetical protein PROFUN_00095 [Planoprotostelium fungivorum]